MEEYNNEVIIVNQNSTPETETFKEYLEFLNLPTENIIAETSDRKAIIKILPDLLLNIPAEQKRNANYLSKFVTASTIGLFDAALNYLWNEVIINLREKIVFYGLETFYDNAVGEKRRHEYNTIEDLSGIKDKTLLDTCKKLEWISDIIHRKLCYILDMRNQIGASHPNFSTINSYELVSWLDICVKDVINEKASHAAIMSKGIIENIKNLDESIDDETLKSMELSFKDFPTNITSTLIISLFGIYISDKTSTIVRNNILLVSSKLWIYTLDATKYELGTKVEFFKNNLEKEKAELAHTFFEKCDGLNYLTINTKSLIISNLCDELLIANQEYNNYYNEPPIAREIMKYIKNYSDIPKEQTTKIINTFLECRIGREVGYCNGVSPGAKSIYDNFFSLLSKEQVKILIYLLKDHLDSVSENNKIKIQNIKEILKIIQSDVIGERLNEIINYLIKCVEENRIHTAYKQNDFKDLCNGVIEF